MSAAPSAGESAWVRGARRAVTIPGYALLTALALGTLPVTVLAALLVDAVRGGPLRTVRLVLFLAFYLACESFGLVAAGLVWLEARLRPSAGTEHFHARNYALQGVWAAALFAGARRLFRLRLEVAGEDAVGPGPLLVFMRHASVGDTLLPALVLSRRHGLRLRYVIKRELLWDPCLDVVGHRLPNVFVRRDSGQSEREIAAIAALAEDLGRGEGILIYPEGTRFTPAKRERVLDRIARSGDGTLLARARGLRHVLPPRLGGPLALLDAAPKADVLFVAHVGFEGTARFDDLWAGRVIGSCVSVRLWRVPADELPPEREARVAWLYDHWQRVDAWIDTQRKRSRSAAPPGGGAP